MSDPREYWVLKCPDGYLTGTGTTHHRELAERFMRRWAYQAVANCLCERTDWRVVHVTGRRNEALASLKRATIEYLDDYDSETLRVLADAAVGYAKSVRK